MPLRQLFDYLPAQNGVIPLSGQRVVVPFGRRKMVGVIVEVANQSELPLDKLATVIDYPDVGETVLTDELLGLLKWSWHYYKHAPGEVVFNALPPLLRKPGSSIPPAPVLYRLTGDGEARLTQPAGRLKAQMALLEKIHEGVNTPQQMRAFAASWRKTLARLVEQGWVQAEAWQPAELAPSPGPELMDEQSSNYMLPRSLIGEHKK